MLFALAMVCVMGGAPQSSALRGGAAEIDLTPPMSMKAALGGYGERMSRPATGVHDPLQAMALVLEESGRRVAIVTADVLAFPPDVRNALLQRLASGLPAFDGLILLPSHTHAGIDMTAIAPRNDLGIPQLGIFQKELLDFTLERLERLVRNASQSLVAVKLGWAQARLRGWNQNRRTDGATVDDTLTVIRCDRLDGRPLAALVQWTAHPTFLGPADMAFSAGWPGFMRRELAARIGGGVTTLYANGAQGDQAPVSRGGATGYEQAEHYGRDLAGEAYRVWARVGTTARLPIAVAYRPVTLPERRWHPDFMKTGGAEYGMAPEIAQRALDRLAPESTHVSCLRLGDLLIVGVPGELAAGPGLRLKREARTAAHARGAIIGGLADEWISYMLDASKYERGGYEASVSFYGPTLAQVISREAVEAARAVRKAR